MDIDMTRHEIDSIRKTINDLNAILQAGYIYIMVNPGWGDKVKIGYADDLEKRRKDFSGTGFPDPSHVYAAYAVPERLEDKEIHALIDGLNPDLRYANNKEFYVMTPEHAYSILERIAKVSGTLGLLKKNPLADSWFNDTIDKPILNTDSAKFVSRKGHPTSWTDLGLKNGDKLVCQFDDKEGVVVDVEKRLVLMNGESEPITLSGYCRKVNNDQGYWQGTAYFTFNGKLLAAIARENGLLHN